MEYIKPFQKIEIELAFLTKLLTNKYTTNAIGLDLGCGSGLHLNHIHQKFPNIYGVDLHKKVDFENYYCVDFFKEKIPCKNLDFIYCLSPNFDSNWWIIEYLFNSLSHNLKLGGKFLLDLFDFNSFDLGELWIKRKIYDGKLIISNFKRFDKTVICTKEIMVNGRVTSLKMIKWRVFSLYELENLAQNTGFELVETFSNYSLEPAIWQPNLERSRIHILFEKQKDLM